jgi:hypothetical protein
VKQPPAEDTAILQALMNAGHADRVEVVGKRFPQPFPRPVVKPGPHDAMSVTRSTVSGAGHDAGRHLTTPNAVSRSTNFLPRELTMASRSRN